MTEPSRTPAAAALGVAPGADPATARAAFLKLVAAADFVPSEQALAAVTRLDGADVPLSAAAAAAFTAYEQADVDAFVTRYWALPPADRQAGWEALERRCRDGDVRRTLTRLKSGLGVPVVEYPDPDINNLARFVREIYLLPPREQVIRRIEWCVEHVPPENPVSVGKQFQDVDPDLARLVPEFIQDVQNSQGWLSGIKSLSPQARERLERSSIDQAIQSFQKMVEARKPKTPQSRPTGVLPRIVILVILFGGVRGCLEAVRKSGGPPDTPQRQYQLPPPTVWTPRELPNQAAVEKLKKTQDDMKVWLELWNNEQKSGKNSAFPSTSAPTTK